MVPKEISQNAPKIQPGNLCLLMSSPERSRWPIVPTKWRANEQQGDNKEGVEHQPDNQMKLKYKCIRLPSKSLQPLKSHHWRNGGSFWMMVNLCTSKMVKLGNQPVNKWRLDFQGLCISVSMIYPESLICLVGDFCYRFYHGNASVCGCFQK